VSALLVAGQNTANSLQDRVAGLIPVNTRAIAGDVARAFVGAGKSVHANVVGRLSRIMSQADARPVVPAAGPAEVQTPPAGNSQPPQQQQQQQQQEDEQAFLLFRASQKGMVQFRVTLEET
jgi:hypothetical protein